MKRAGAGRGTGGELRVAERVVEKIAALAAADVPGVAGAQPRSGSRPSRQGRHDRRHSDRHIGRHIGGHIDRHRGRPVVTAHISHGDVRLSMSFTVVYPAPIRETAEAVRGQVRERVAALAGLRVTHLDINIPALRPTSMSTDRGLRVR